MTKMSEKRTKQAYFWMFFPVGLLVFSVSGWLFMVSLAVDDPGFSVEADYYQKASNYDEIIAQRAENARLRWELSVEEFAPRAQGSMLRVRATDGGNQPLSGLTLSAMAFPTARGDQIQHVEFVERGAGTYEAQVQSKHAGLWEVRFEARQNLELFTQTLRPELSAGTSEGEGPS